MPKYIVDDRMGEINQIGPFEAEDIRIAFALLLTHEFKNFNKNIDMEIVDDEHGYIVINLPGGVGMSMKWARWKPSLRQMRGIWRGRVRSNRTRRLKL